MWRILTTLLILYRVSSTRRLVRQSTPDRHKKAPLTFRLVLLSICSCLLSLALLWRYSLSHSWLLGQSPVIDRLHSSAVDGRIGNSSVRSSLATCDIYSGSWVRDELPPKYNSSSCPFLEVGFSCQDNGRPDSDYLNWRWQPTGCDLPWFDASEIRHKLHGLRVAFVGDSMGRTQWESLICLLMADLTDKRTVYEVNRKPVTKTMAHLAVRFSTFNFTIEYYRSPFLVEESAAPKSSPRRVRSTLKLDKLETAALRWLNADVLVFNTGHWWTLSKTFGRGCYFQVERSLKLGMSLETAYRLALGTWANWVESKVNLTRTQVFFRSYEPAHWEGSWHNRLCASETKPVQNSSFSEDFPHLPVLEDVIQHMKAPVAVLNITGMSSYRKDSHVAHWTNERNVVDCSHWCLPGLPDSWNIVLYAALLQRGQGVWLQQ